MATVYRSKIDTWLLVVLVSAMAISGFASIAVMFSDSPAKWWVIVQTLGVGVALPLWLLVSTRYTLDAHLLIVRCGPFKWRIPIADITGISPTANPLSSPALSLDRLRIDYDRSRQLMISPRDKAQFLQDIKLLRRGVA